MYDRALDTFDAYSAPQRRSPCLQAIRMSVRARRAETMYRLGYREEARRQWSGLLAEDYFDLEAARNIAVCDSRSGDLRRCLDSWRAYADMLYFRDISSANPSRHAAQRAEFHRHFGNAYAPRPFHDATEKNQPEADRDEVAAFFLSPARVRLHMRHRLMELMNARLALQTAPFLLGVTRGARPEERDAACEKVEKWVRQLCGYLPRRVGPRFASIVSGRLAEALALMKSPKEMRDLAGNARYEDDKQRFLAWLNDILKWKIRLHFLLQNVNDLSTRPELLDVLVELCAADEIPIDTSEELLAPVAFEFRQSAELFCTLVSMTASSSVMQLLHFVFPDHSDSDSGSADQRVMMYRRLTGELTDRAIMNDSVRRIIDYPAGVEGFNLYPDSVANVFRHQSETPSPADVAYMRSLHERYPVSSGIARDYAILLALSREHSEARTVLTATIPRAFHSSGREACEELLKQISGDGS
jgi:hypothetical protein